MVDISRKQAGVIAIPLVAIAILLPVALIFGFAADDTNETRKPGDAGGSSDVAGAPAADTVIRAQDIAWSPADVEVRQGSTVGFQNLDQTRHNVTIDGKSVGDIEGGQSLTWDASEPGEFTLVCEYHPNDMTGTITVVG